MILTGEGDAARLPMAEVSASLFNVLRVRPQIGRVFNADENTPGRTNVVDPVARCVGAALRQRPLASSGAASCSTACRVR